MKEKIFMIQTNLGEILMAEVITKEEALKYDPDIQPLYGENTIYLRHAYSVVRNFQTYIGQRADGIVQIGAGSIMALSKYPDETLLEKYKNVCGIDSIKITSDMSAAEKIADRLNLLK